jgi:hypothetical protein
MGRREATFLPPEEWPEARAWLQSAVEHSRTPKRKVLLAMRYEGGTNRLNSYFRGPRLPTPATLQPICEAAHLSYVEAVDRFGYYREIIKIFDDLTWLGATWCEEDGARGGSRRGSSYLDSLRDTGVIYWRNHPITWGRDDPAVGNCDPRKDAAFAPRYCVAVRHEAKPRIPHVSVVPKPIAVAILLGTLAFPMRGDVYKQGARQYRYELAKESDALVREAKRRRAELRSAGRPKSLHRFLERASIALDDSSLPFYSRRTIAAEYINAWASDICEPFAHYARLAAFDYWGEAGGRPWTSTTAPLKVAPEEKTRARISAPSVYTRMPQPRQADLPDIEMLTTYK